jgi:hypothetical protein
MPLTMFSARALCGHGRVAAGRPHRRDGYFIREKFRSEEADRQLAEYLKQQDEDWAKGIRASSKGIRDVCPELPPEYWL